MPNFASPGGVLAGILGAMKISVPESMVARSTGISRSTLRAWLRDEVVSIDFKGWFRTGDGTRVDPLTVLDNYSRYALCCQALAAGDGSHVRAVLETTFRAYGLPRRVRSDNGSPFASRALGGLSRLSVWLLKLGVEVERIAPASPSQNGRQERFHRTLKQHTATQIEKISPQLA